MGVAEWETLETVADVRRFLRWVILSFRDRTLKPNEASIFAQIGGVMLKTVQVSNFEDRLTRIEEALKVAEVADGDTGSQTTSH